MGHEPPGSVPADDRADGADNAMLAALTERARCKFIDLADQGYAETGHEFPAPWTDAHIERLGGWKRAPS